MATKRTSFTLPPAFVADLDFLARRLGVSRSAVLAEVAADPVHDLAELIAKVPENPTAADILRARGESVQVINQRIDNLRGMATDLFSDLD